MHAYRMLYILLWAIHLYDDVCGTILYLNDYDGLWSTLWYDVMSSLASSYERVERRKGAASKEEEKKFKCKNINRFLKMHLRYSTRFIQLQLQQQQQIIS